MHKLLYNNEIDRISWNKALSSVNASPFQTASFFDAINELNRYVAHAFALEKNNQIQILAVVVIYKETGIKSFFSRRGIIYGGPIIQDASIPEFESFLKFIQKKIAKKVIYIESRNFFDYSNYSHAFLKQNWDYLPYVNYQLNIIGKTKESILKKFKYNRRREIKQSLSNNAIYYQTENLKEVKEIYLILEDLYKSKVKLPIPPFDFFEKLLNKRILKAFVVKHNERIIGGSFCPFMENKGLYTFYYCGFRDYHKQIFPSHLAVLAALEFAIEKNNSLFDFMGAGLKDEKYGVREYKKAFGGELVEHGRFRKITSPLLYKIGKFGIVILSKF